jgi:ubiquinone/menaquinone biosynthesis C-methylase UbiE
MKTSELKANLIESYNKYAREREAGSIDGWRIEKRMDFLSLLKADGKKSMLEIGAGTGKDSLFFQENGMDVTCIDLSPEMVKFCKLKGLSAQVMDMADLQFPENSFDAVYTFNSLLHIPKTDLPLVLKNIQTVLKPNGLFHLGIYGKEDEFEGVWEKDSYTPKRFFAFYSDENIQQITAQYFQLSSFKRVTFDGSDLHFQCLILRKP